MGASLGVLVGSIFVPQIRPFSDLAEGGIGVLFLKFGRDDELQADALGAEYAAAGRWDPEQVPAFLTTLARIAEVTDRNGVPNWLSTHPQPENRAARVGETVKKLRATTRPVAESSTGVSVAQPTTDIPVAQGFPGAPERLREGGSP